MMVLHVEACDCLSGPAGGLKGIYLLQRGSCTEQRDFIDRKMQSYELVTKKKKKLET